MTFAAATATTRRAKPSHEPWVPLPYMVRAADHLTSSGAGGLPLRPGGRKTSITLEAFRRLQERGLARRMLVVAPLRVCRQTWRQEAAKWTEFRHLRFSLLHGAKKAERLKDDADIWLINPEGVPWLAQQFLGRSLPFDVVTIDELTRFKNHQSVRSKSLRPRLKGVRYRWGLTGSLAPNGFMDLFGQMLMLDDGAALGRYITHYRDQYFQLDYNGFDYTLMPGAEKRIIVKIAPYWFQMSESDYAQLPQLVQDPRYLEMDKASRAAYEAMKRDMLAQLPDGLVTAANAAAAYAKLSQMANGAVYMGDGRSVSTIHSVKLEALDELVEELNGEPLLVGYEFNHDLSRLQEWHRARFGRDLPYLGKGTTAAQEDAYLKAWNNNELPVLAAHPASAGHGLNMQYGSAAHVCWFGPIWDLELWDQFLRRIRRDGNNARQIFQHILIMRGTIDELKMEALSDKDATQSRLIRGLNQEIQRDAGAHATGDTAALERNVPMSTKLSRQSDASAEEAPRTITPKGWGRPTAVTEDTASVERQAPQPAQRERIVNQLRGNAAAEPVEEAQESQEVSMAEKARSAFSPAVRTQMKDLKAPAGEADKMAAEVDHAADAKVMVSAKSRGKRAPAAPGAVPHEIRLEVLKIAFRNPDTSVEEGIAAANDLLEFVAA